MSRKNSSIAERAHPSAPLIQKEVAKQRGVFVAEASICRTCMKVKGGLENAKGYCYLNQHAEPPATGYCSEYIPDPKFVWESDEGDGMYELNVQLVGALI